MTAKRLYILIPNDGSDDKLKEVLKAFDSVIESSLLAYDKKVYLVMVDELEEEIRKKLEELEKNKEIRVIDLLLLREVKKAREIPMKR